MRVATAEWKNCQGSWNLNIMLQKVPHGLTLISRRPLTGTNHEFMISMPNFPISIKVMPPWRNLGSFFPLLLLFNQDLSILSWKVYHRHWAVASCASLDFTVMSHRSSCLSPSLLSQIENLCQMNLLRVPETTALNDGESSVLFSLCQ